jgi:hypothetical protein|tara:strand:- start:2682 stop:3290 length:609 start_codon:yes stop_codon:yes gene_type:complete
MDALYYSNYCKHSQRILQYLVKANLTDRISFLCIDKRQRDENNNQMYIVLENGQRVVMPPNVQSVPALLLVKRNYQVILGDDIISHFQADAQQESKKKTANFQGEPIGTSLMPSNGGVNIVSEPYTMFNLTPEELSAKGNGGRRQMYNYVSANDDILSINTPPDTYQPDKIENDITVDNLQQKRMDDIQPPNQNQNVFVPKL